MDRAPVRPVEGARLRFLSTRAGALLAFILGSGMAFIDTTVVNIALPAIGDDLGAGFAGFQWVVNGYLLALGSLVLIGGSLSDRFGRHRVFEMDVLAFAVASTA